ncbi:hypothetical protein NPIL_554111 [Nephila pilipes]|uniref:Uncharacterized protein n=1 Tax=Nephila pilipes TaxID=299642 RepID=A0A8X6PLB6_NEPPI|nr:hypothetical protein NPIL_554111 [Nephila pilipes]
MDGLSVSMRKYYIMLPDGYDQPEDPENTDLRFTNQRLLQSHIKDYDELIVKEDPMVFGGVGTRFDFEEKIPGNMNRTVIGFPIVFVFKPGIKASPERAANDAWSGHYLDLDSLFRYTICRCFCMISIVLWVYSFMDRTRFRLDTALPRCHCLDHCAVVVRNEGNAVWVQVKVKDPINGLSYPLRSSRQHCSSQLSFPQIGLLDLFPWPSPRKPEVPNNVDFDNVIG